MAKKGKKNDEVVQDPPAEASDTATEVATEEGAEKAPRHVTRYGVEYDGNAYTSPRKALDAAGLTEVKGSRLRARFKKAGNEVGTTVEYEGKTFKYIEVPASVESDESEVAEETEE